MSALTARLRLAKTGKDREDWDEKRLETLQPNVDIGIVVQTFSSNMFE